MLKLHLLNMAFGLVHSSVEQSSSRHDHLQASARLLYRLALVLVLGLIVWKWVKPCKIQAVPGFARNVNFSTSQTHSFLSN